MTSAGLGHVSLDPAHASTRRGDRNQHGVRLLGARARTIEPVGWIWVVLLGSTAVQRTWFAWRHLPRTPS